MLDPARTGRIKTEIMAVFSNKDAVLTTDDVCLALPDLQRNVVRMTLARLVSEGMLHRIHQGKLVYQMAAV